MGRPVPGELLDVVRSREQVLRALDGDGRTKADLEAALDVSRSTIDRAIRELEEAGLVERAAAGYCQTLTGRLALAEYDRFTGRLAGLAAAGEMLRSLDRDVEVGPALLGDAEVVTASRTSPHRPIEELYGYVERATRVRGFAPAVHPQQVDTYLRRVRDEGMRADIVLTDEAVERLVAEYPDELSAGLDVDHATLRRTDADLPYSLTVADLEERTVVGLMVYGGVGRRGCIINDSDEAVTWALERYASVLERAEPVA